MANHKSAIKRQRQNEKRRIRNKGIRTLTRTSIKNVRVAAADENPEAAVAALAGAAKQISVAGSKGIYHKKTVSRQISRLTKLVNKLKNAG